jgi:uncharacterized damage-inducible protein DinB
MHDHEEFLRYFDRVRSRTRAVVDRIPADALEWRYHPDRFSLGDLVRHIAAAERWMFAENARGKPSRYPGHGPALAHGLEGVIEYMERMHDDSMEIFRGLTPERLAARCPTPGGVEIRTWKWLRSMVEHEIHHRGQIYLILGVLRVDVPPLYGLTEQEVKARSSTGP